MVGIGQPRFGRVWFGLPWYGSFLNEEIKMIATASLNDAPPAALASPRRSLFEIANEYRATFDTLCESTDDGGEIPSEIAAAFDSVEMEMSRKLDACYKMFRTLETEAAAADEELDRLKRLVAGRKKRADWMKKYILDSMLAAGVTKHEGKTCVLRIQKNSRPSISIDPPTAEIPESYRKVKIEFDGDKAYQDWKNDKPLPECVLVIEGCHLRTAVPK
jgi:hypothetical protein